MTLPVVTRAQLEPLLEKLLEKLLAAGSDEAGPVVLVRADPAAVPAGVSVGGRPVEVLATSSPLEIRARVSEPRSAPLVVLTGCDNEALGSDLLARSVKRRLHTVNRWVSVCGLFGADRPSRALAQHPELADALLEAKPVGGYPRLVSKVLDLDSALDALVRWHLQLVAFTLPLVLDWAESPPAARVLRPGGPVTENVIDLLTGHVAAQVDDGVRFAFAVARAGRGDELMALALAADVVHGQGVDGDPSQLARARAMLDVALAGPDGTGPELTPAVYRLAGAAAVQRVRDSTDKATAARWLARADQLASQWKVADHAWRSPVLVSGFPQRLARAATAITTWWTSAAAGTSAAGPGPRPRGAVAGAVNGAAAALEADAMAAVALVAGHRQAGDERERVERLEMAARLVRRGSGLVATPGTLGGVVAGYTREGAWLDRARFSVGRRDPVPELAALCAELTAVFDADRSAQGAELAKATAGAVHPLPAELTGIEAVLDTVVAPLAAQVPVLVVVLDGMGWPTFTEVLERMEEEGWTPFTDPAGVAVRPVLAALPTVTEVSRTSLLAGRLRKGDNASEKRAFATHPALKAAGAKSWPPKLFHKAEFRAGGIDTTSEAVAAAIREEKRRVVGLVINNIDERLKDVASPPGGWGMAELTPLRSMLEVARAAGRVVVLTADHGHVLDRGAEQRPSGGGGERWRTVASGPAGDGEIHVEGPRVVLDSDKPGGAVVLPWAEQVRYAPLRNGYHGGLTLAEVVVPLAVLSIDVVPDGWTPHAVSPPSWWHPTIGADLAGAEVGAAVEPSAAIPTPSPAPVRARPNRPEPETLTLFDTGPLADEPAAVAAGSGPGATPGGGDPIGRIMAAAQIQARLPGLRLDPDLVARYLAELDRTNGTWTSELRVADAIVYNRSRIGRLTSQVQRLVNLDGYTALETRDGEIRFDRSLLETQLGLR